MILPAVTPTSSVMSAKSTEAKSSAAFSMRGRSAPCRRDQFKNSNLKVGQSASSPFHFDGPACVAAGGAAPSVAIADVVG